MRPSARSRVSRIWWTAVRYATVASVTESSPSKIAIHTSMTRRMDLSRTSAGRDEGHRMSFLARGDHFVDQEVAHASQRHELRGRAGNALAQPVHEDLDRVGRGLGLLAEDFFAQRFLG